MTTKSSPSQFFVVKWDGKHERGVNADGTLTDPNEAPFLDDTTASALAKLVGGCVIHENEYWADDTD